VGTVATLKGSQLLDLLLQQVPLATELLKYRGPLLLGLGDHFGGTLARLGDQALMLGIGLGHERLGLGDERVVLGLAGGHELVVLGLTGREKLFLSRCGFTNNLVVA
jgi:hypothetical protein